MYCNTSFSKKQEIIKYKKQKMRRIFLFYLQNMSKAFPFCQNQPKSPDKRKENLILYTFSRDALPVVVLYIW